MKNLKSKKRSLWVIKAGSEMVLGGGPLLIRHWMQQVAELRKRNIQVIWVTSGAIASARTLLKKNPRTLPEKQALSAIGQPLIMDAYSLALQTLSLKCAQVLLTEDDISDPVRARNLKNSLRQILSWQSVPILNENDAVATEEIRFGDNDRLSMLVARMMRAQKLIILTDVDGLFDCDPKKFRAAKLISKIQFSENKMIDGISVSAASLKGKGSGGMLSKLNSARAAQAAGISCHLLRGDLPSGILKIENGDEVGSEFLVKGRSKK